MAPTSNKTWTVAGMDGFESLKFNEKGSMPEIGEHDVLVRFHYASLNYRDLIIPMVSSALPRPRPGTVYKVQRLTTSYRASTLFPNEIMSSPPRMAQAQSKLSDHA